MGNAPLPPNEGLRIEALHRAKILDTDPERGFDDLVGLAAHLFETPISLVSLVDSDRQWFKARIGLDRCETPREFSFCAHAILGDEVLVVPDAKLDKRFAQNPLVTSDPRIRFYAGAVLYSPEGQPLGSLCVIDTVPREISTEQEQALAALARLARDQLVTRANLAELKTLIAEVKTLEGILPVCAWCKKIRDDDGYWSAVDDYLTARADVKITHGMCPACVTKTHPGAIEPAP